MKTSVFLVFSKSGLLKATKQRSALARGQVGIRLAVTIPDESFAPVDRIVDVELNVPREKVVEPPAAVVEVWDQ